MTTTNQPSDAAKSCRIGSCQRHGQCMYSPCRHLTPSEPVACEHEAWTEQHKARRCCDCDAELPDATPPTTVNSDAGLVEALEACLAREKERAELVGLSDCTCANFSRTADREYENGECPHQRATAALSRAKEQPA